MTLLKLHHARGRIVALLATVALLCANYGQAVPLQPNELPDPLKSWVPWVMGLHPDARCPYRFDGEERMCDWPASLDLDLGGKGGKFSQVSTSYQRTWIRLPGSVDYWPQNVQIDGRPAVVTAHDDLPSVLVTPGTHGIKGEFYWSERPETLQVPPATGLLTLSVDGRKFTDPSIDDDGRLWLQSSQNISGQAARIEVKMYRRVRDGVPLEVVTLFRLRVAGAAREVVLPGGLLPGQLPQSLNSPLAAKLDPDGSLRIQVRAGEWDVELVSRSTKQVRTLSLPAAFAQSGSDEIWVFEANPDVRQVDVQGPPQVDPAQTQVPEEWKASPAYRMKAGATMQLHETRTGDAMPAPDSLRLARNIWMDFSGAGYSMQDTITGQVNRSWRMEADPGISLGRVALDDVDQLITRAPQSRRDGVEMRHGIVKLQANSRIESNSGTLPAAGWNADFNSVSATLNLPPGWRLWHASGVDRAQGAWLERWNLLDFFIVLLATAASSRMWGKAWGGITLVALTLTYYEPEAPRWLWINLLLAIAALRVVAPGKLRNLVQAYRWIAFAALTVTLLSFGVLQARSAFYPVLEHPWQPGQNAEVRGGKYVAAPAAAAPAAVAADEPAAAPADASGLASGSAVRSLNKAKVSEPRTEADKASQTTRAFEEYDPGAIVQTGKGLPQWTWNSYDLHWSGPVDKQQSMHFWVTSPAMNAAITLLRIILAGLLAWRALDRRSAGPRLRFGPGAGRMLLAAMVVGGGMLGQPSSARADIPNPEQIKALETRLLEKPDCLPACADVSEIHINLSGDQLIIRLAANLDTDSAFPLPGGKLEWRPESVVVDGSRAVAMRSHEGALWISLASGVHQVIMSGSVKDRNDVALSMPLKPHRTEVTLAGWSMLGQRDNGGIDGGLLFTRQDPSNQIQSGRNAFPPLIRIERTISLGLKWGMHVRVQRISQEPTATSVSVPLLAGESVITPDIQVRGGKVVLAIPANADSVEWDSGLALSPSLSLTASRQPNLFEQWRLEAGTMWHVDPVGLTPIHSQVSQRWAPEWLPWPGESLTLKMARPQGVPGPSLTIDRSTYHLTPGARSTLAAFSFVLRSSKGGQHVVTLPDGADLLGITIDGASHPARLEGRRVVIPVNPGEHQVSLNWQQPTGISTHYVSPELNLGVASANSYTTIHIPENRWILFVGGPAMGPAILFWGILVIAVGLAFTLGKSSQTPLRTRDWLLLGLGLTQSPYLAAVTVVAWLFAAGFRRSCGNIPSKALFNGMQVALALLTIAAVSSLVVGVTQGLLGRPDMQILGNGSSASLLTWYQDISPAILPASWLISLPLWTYRVLMLLWAMWLAFALIKWLRWYWECFASGGYWRKIEFRRRSESTKS